MLALDMKEFLFGCLFCIAIGWLAVSWRLQRHNQLKISQALSLSWQLCEMLPFGMLILEPDNKIVFMNATARQIITTMAGKTDSEISEVLKNFNLANRSSQQSGVAHQKTLVRWWRGPLDNTSKSLLILTEIADYQHSLRYQTFIGQLGHELRTPLTSLIAHSEIAANKVYSENVREASVQTIQRETERMSRLVRDMLELYRLETGDGFLLKPTNLVLVAEEAIAQLILKAEQLNIELIFKSEVIAIPILAHPDRIKQVFLNLIDNSLKYCRAGDKIWVELQKEPDGVLCLVRDSGPGISPEDLPHVTEFLYRSRASTEGHGIGLALVQEILRQHHTNFVIESNTAKYSSGTICSWKLHYSLVAEAALVG